MSLVIWITGARGFIGRHLARHLAASDHQVGGVGHGIWPDTEARRWGISHWLNGDITSGNLRTLQKATGTPDVVYHLAGGSSVGAAVANPREDFFRTVVSTAELLDWLRLDAPATRLVAISSAAVYGAGHSGRIPESAHLSPFSPYGHHKRLMEELCRSYALSYGQRTTVARLFSVYGPGLKKQLLWDLCSRLAAGASPLGLGGSGDELRDWTDVRDVVRALDGLADTASTELPVYNVGTGVSTPVRDVASLLAQAWAGDGPAAPLAFTEASRVGDPFSLVADPARLEAQGFAWHRPLERGVTDYVRWFRSSMQDGEST